MYPFKLDEIPKRSRAELMAQLEELKAELKKLREERSLPGAKVPNKLSSEMDKLRPFLAEVSKKQRAALQEEYKNREPLILRLNSHRLNSQDDPCCTADCIACGLSFSEDGKGKEA